MGELVGLGDGEVEARTVKRVERVSVMVEITQGKTVALNSDDN